MTRLQVLTDDSLRAIHRDHERLRYEVNNLQTMLRSFRCELTDGGKGGNAVAVTTVIIPARSGTTPGGPIECQRMKLNSAATFVVDGPVIDVYSWVKSPSSDPAGETGGELWIFIEQDAHGVWWFTGEDCP
jgi:hypothetical protein